MAKNDQELAARKIVIDELTVELNRMLPAVLAETGIKSNLSLNALYGGKFADYINIKDEIIHSPDHFVSIYLDGFLRKANDSREGSAHKRNLALLRASPRLQEYLYIFLKRVYLRNFDALSKKRPPVEEAVIWIGQNNADYGLLITPRFNIRLNQWENDKSEIRHFEPNYWSIGHILRTGLAIPGKNSRIPFGDIEAYLNFFLNVLVRNSGSRYEYKLAEMYCDYIRSSKSPQDIPLLIPELRYEGPVAAHKYRLDFTIITSPDLTKIGFELSPWSTHGYLSKTKELTQAEINRLAQDNFEKEMHRHKEFFIKHGIFVLIYTDSELADLGRIFGVMQSYLEPKAAATQLRFHLVRDVLGQ